MTGDVRSMAILRQGETWVNVTPGLVVGRAGSGLVLEDDGVSRHHALLDYRGEVDGAVGFYVRDLGSTNGTFLDRGRIPSGVPMRLGEGVELRFGELGAPWVVVDAGPPNPAFVCEGTLTVASDEALMLPDETSAECTVARDGLRWLQHVGERAVVVQSGQSIELGGRRYLLLLPDYASRAPATKSRPGAQRPRLVLRTNLSRDDLREATLVIGSAAHDLGRHVHNRVLLALANARTLDEAKDRPLLERGWRSTRQLAQGLGIDRSVLHVWTCRLRHRIREAGAELIEDEHGGPHGGRRRLGECVIEMLEN
jgi:hypothetical protein